MGSKPGVGQEFRKLMRLMGRQTLEGILEISERFEPLTFARSHEIVDCH